MRTKTRRFGIEQLACVLALVCVAVALHTCLTSAPSLLPHRQPLASCDGPAPVVSANLAPLLPENTLVSGSRKSPLHPVRPLVVVPPSPGTSGNNTGGDGGNEKHAGSTVASRPAKSYPPVDPALPLEFVGVVFMGGSAHGLVRPQDGSAPYYVRPGDSIPAYGCTVTAIERQAIRVSGLRQVPFVLADGRFPRGAARLSEPRP